MTQVTHSKARSTNCFYVVAYYDEYMPYDRLEVGIIMMKETGINVVDIAKSTWSTVEPSHHGACISSKISHDQRLKNNYKFFVRNVQNLSESGSLS